MESVDSLSSGVTTTPPILLQGLPYLGKGGGTTGIKKAKEVMPEMTDLDCGLADGARNWDGGGRLPFLLIRWAAVMASSAATNRKRNKQARPHHRRLLTPLTIG